MYPLLETLACRDGKFTNLDRHQTRLESARREIWGEKKHPLLTDILPPVPDRGVYKCRLLYGRDSHHWEVLPYTRPAIQGLIARPAPDLDYHLKYADRSPLDILRQDLPPDRDVLIIQDGRITDTSTCNVALLQAGRWYTPQHCLLPGTRRAALLDAGIIEIRDILLDDLSDYTHIVLFNALLGWEDAIRLDTFSIRKG